jgi:TonB family protein
MVMVLALFVCPSMVAARTQQAHATLEGTVYDPLGAPVEGILVFIESGAFGSGISDERRTDKAGRYVFDRLPPGVYVMTVSVDAAPDLSVALESGQRLRQDIRMQLEEVTATFAVCVDCPATAQTYSPPESLVREFALDREAAAKQPVIGAEPPRGWALYLPDVQVSDTMRQRGLTGTVVLEGRIDADGLVKHVKVASSAHPELGAAATAALEKDTWKPATVYGTPVAVPFRIVVEFMRLGARR